MVLGLCVGARQACGELAEPARSGAGFAEGNLCGSREFHWAPCWGALCSTATVEAMYLPSRIFVACTFLLLTACGGLSSEQESPQSQSSASVSPTHSPIGFFFFSEEGQLDQTSLQDAYVRTAIEWSAFEPAPGIFDFARTNRQAEKIDALLAKGKRVIPSIRAKSDWAVMQEGGKCASPPLDLDRATPLQGGKSYSPSYASFVKNIAEHYRGKFEIVVIENEMNDPDFWCGSSDDYLRLFATAKKVFAEVDPEVKLTDSGVQGVILNWLVVEDYLKRGDAEEATSFYRKVMGESITEEELMKETERMASKKAFLRARELLEGPLFSWVAIVNFHYYQRSAALPDVVSFLRKNMKAEKPLMTNEIGIKQQFVASADEAAKELVKKYVQLLALDVAPILWFSVGGDEEHNAGALVDNEGKLIEETTQAFETLAKFFVAPPLSHREDVLEGVQRFRFAFPGRTLDVLWAKETSEEFPLTIPEGCEVVNYRGRALPEKNVSPSDAPVFVVCGK